MKSEKNLLILNLGIDSNDTSLGFTQTWINELNKEYKRVDVITMRLGKSDLNEEIGIFPVNEEGGKLTKFNQIKKIHKTFKHVLNNCNYDHCFAHMSPLLLVIGSRQLKTKGIKSTLWFTHPGPKFGVKKIVLLIASFVANSIVTASKHSFPFKFKKLNIVGHGIDFSRFEKKERSSINKFLYLGRISESKKVHVIVERFLRFNEANNNNYSLTLIGGALNSADDKYLRNIKELIDDNPKIKLIGKIPHKDLSRVIKDFDCNINIAKKGFFDKAVLETLYSGMINICLSEDYKQFYPKEYHNKLFVNEDLNQLDNIMQYLISLENFEIDSIIKYASNKLELHSLKTLPKRFKPIFN